MENNTQLLTDWLPDGTDQNIYVQPDKEWPSLINRLGKNRITKHPYYGEIINDIRREVVNLDNFAFFEAGCGHGNDLRVVRNEFGARGNFLGVDISWAEITHGLVYYQETENEDIIEARQLFAQGDLRNLHRVNLWDNNENSFSFPFDILDNSFHLVYMTSILHGLGYGEGSYQGKKEAAQQMLNELGRICLKGGRFFGKANVFNPSVSLNDRLALLRQSHNWHFIPGRDELEEMIEKAGFKDLQIELSPHEKAVTHPDKKDLLKFNFVAKK